MSSATATTTPNAKARMYRCMVCTDPATGKHGVEFTATEKVCPHCGIDGREPRNAGIIHSLVVMHFEPPTRIPFRGAGYIACDPSIKVGQGPVSTGVATVANCPRCKETQVYKDSYAVATFDVRHDFPVVITRDGVKKVDDAEDADDTDLLPTSR